MKSCNNSRSCCEATSKLSYNLSSFNNFPKVPSPLSKSAKSVFTFSKVWSRVLTVFDISTSFKSVERTARSSLTLLKLEITAVKLLSFFEIKELKE